ncbi:phage tail assembly chaperone [Pseudomonas helvetica]|uniref:phage tail assembly chaperone n=1 Tax=Pseudomonas helvetica TaxID=3136738 RepID=UPI0032664ACF
MNGTILFSARTRGAYIVGLNGADIPDDVIEIPRAYWLSLLEALARSPKIISVRPEDGYPILVDPPSVSTEVSASNERAWRDSELFQTDGLVARHRDELETGGATTLSAAEYEALQTYRRNLRNWPVTEKFPALTERPVLIAPVSIMAAPVRKTRVRKSVKPVEPTIAQ